MPETGTREAVRPALVAALAGSALLVGLVALVEVASLLLPATRRTFETWGPVATIATLAATLVIGLPSALLVEGLTARLGRRDAVATLLGYLLAVLIWAGSFTVAWRATVDGTATPLDLATEIGLMLAGGLLIWAGARLADRPRVGAMPVLAASGAAVVALAVASVAVLAG